MWSCWSQFRSLMITPDPWCELVYQIIWIHWLDQIVAQVHFHFVFSSHFLSFFVLGRWFKVQVKGTNSLLNVVQVRSHFGLISYRMPCDVFDSSPPVFDNCCSKAKNYHRWYHLIPKKRGGWRLGRKLGETLWGGVRWELRARMFKGVLREW